MTGMTEKTKKIWVLVLASTASCMVALDAMVVTTVLGAIRAGLGASLESLEWTVNAYNLNFAVLLLTGIRSATASDVGVSSAPASVCLLSHRSPGAWRTVSLADRRPCRSGRRCGLGGAAGDAHWPPAFPREERGRALGIFSSITGIALIAGR